MSHGLDRIDILVVGIGAQINRHPTFSLGVVLGQFDKTADLISGFDVGHNQL